LRLKLDENFGNGAIELFREGGHEVATVVAQNLRACTNRERVGV